jgi:hypothetical protein
MVIEQQSYYGLAYHLTQKGRESWQYFHRQSLQLLSPRKLT